MRKNSAFVAAAALLLPALSGCGGGGDDPLLNGVWRNVSVRLGNSVVNCPGSISSGDTEVSCGPSDTLTFGNSTFRDDSLGDSGIPQRTLGTYTRDGVDLIVTLTQAAEDRDGSGAYEPDEVETLDPPTTVTFQIASLTGNRLVLELANNFAATYTRQAGGF